MFDECIKVLNTTHFFYELLLSLHNVLQEILGYRQMNP